MNEKQFNWKKAIKIVLLIGLIGFGIYLALITAGVMMIFNAGSDHTELTGEIQTQSKTFHVGEPIPLELIVPEELSDIHGLMWEYEVKESDNAEFDNIIEGENLKAYFTDEELKILFGKDELEYDRIAVFTPDQSETFTISIYGFYRQTNPQYITNSEVIVIE